MNKKVIIGVGILAVGLAIANKDKLFPKSETPGSSGSSSQYEGMVVKSEGSANIGWYRIINGKRVIYQDGQAYANDGSRQIVNLPHDQMMAIPMDWTRYISANGFVNERPII